MSLNEGEKGDEISVISVAIEQEKQKLNFIYSA